MRTKLIETGNAKINLFLDVTGRRPDGYHDLHSCMQTVALSDTVSAELWEEEGAARVSLTVSDSALPCDERNLAFRAARLFLSEIGAGGCEWRLHVEKRIPVAAGLGGGSADAAAVLRLLNRHYGKPYDNAGLCALGARLGADVPFCIAGGTCRCRGVGDILTQLQAPPDYTVLVARDGEGVSTPEAFALLDRRFGDFSAHEPRDPEKIYTALSCGNVQALSDCVYNVFEDVIFPVRPKAEALKRFLQEHGAVCALMSGSGPSVFGIFQSDARAEVCAAALHQRGIFAAVCRTVG